MTYRAVCTLISLLSYDVKDRTNLWMATTMRERLRGIR